MRDMEGNSVWAMMKKKTDGIFGGVANYSIVRRRNVDV